MFVDAVVQQNSSHNSRNEGYYCRSCNCNPHSRQAVSDSMCTIWRGREILLGSKTSLKYPTCKLYANKKKRFMTITYFQYWNLKAEQNGNTSTNTKLKHWVYCNSWSLTTQWSIKKSGLTVFTSMNNNDSICQALLGQIHNFSLNSWSLLNLPLSMLRYCSQICLFKTVVWNKIQKIFTTMVSWI